MKYQIFESFIIFFLKKKKKKNFILKLKFLVQFLKNKN